MRKISNVIIFIFIAGAVAFLFRNPLAEVSSFLIDRYLPCREPITYSVGSFDERFGISRKEFLSMANIAEGTWEESIDRQLFTHVQNGSGDLKLNLIYDIRQESSQRLKDIGITVDESKASYDGLKTKYGVMQAEYNKLKAEFESRVVLFQARQDAYEREVAYFNKNDGASKNEYERLNKEKSFLETEFVEINNLQAGLNAKADDINALVVALNRLVSSLNIEVRKFNTIGEELGGEFEEGTYRKDAYSREIDIYQFDDKNKLARVLAHEFGHALGLDHLEDPRAVMYRLNNGVNEKLTSEDIKTLKDYCGIR